MNWGLIDRWMTPFLRVGNEVYKTKYLTRFLVPFFPKKLPVTVQLMGNNASVIAKTAVAVMELGAVGINLNFGCPSRQVTSGNAGGGALRHPERMAEILNTVRDALGSSVPLSVKMRTGWADDSEMNALIPRLTAADQLFIHYRTVKELYAPAQGREERLSRACRLFSRPDHVIINGDIDSPETAESLLEAIGAGGVMVARGWLRDPFLLLRIAGTRTDLPDLESGRTLFYRKVCEIAPNFPVGKSIELSNLIWGRAENPFFESLLAQKKQEV